MSADLKAALDALHAELTEADSGGDSSNDLVQIVDTWFVEHGYPSIIYR